MSPANTSSADNVKTFIKVNSVSEEQSFKVKSLPRPGLRIRIKFFPAFRSGFSLNIQIRYPYVVKMLSQHLLIVN